MKLDILKITTVIPIMDGIALINLLERYKGEENGLRSIKTKRIFFSI